MRVLIRANILPLTLTSPRPWSFFSQVINTPKASLKSYAMDVPNYKKYESRNLHLTASKQLKIHSLRIVALSNLIEGYFYPFFHFTNNYNTSSSNTAHSILMIWFSWLYPSSMIAPVLSDFYRSPYYFSQSLLLHTHAAVSLSSPTHAVVSVRWFGGGGE